MNKSKVDSNGVPYDFVSVEIDGDRYVLEKEREPDEVYLVVYKTKALVDVIWTQRVKGFWNKEEAVKFSRRVEGSVSLVEVS